MGKEEKKNPPPAESRENLAEDENERGNWGNQCEFFLSCLGYAVGFGNVWRFPYLAYKNGGAAFLIPYVTMLLCAGLPLFFMDLFIGQYASLGPNIIFAHIAPIFSGLGWAMLVVSGLVAIYYNIILAWTLFYTFFSFTSELPWQRCNGDFNSENCISTDDTAECEVQGLHYWDKECVTTDFMCSMKNLTATLNNTMCLDPDAASDEELVHPDQVVPRISASEDFFQNRMLQVSGRSWEDMGGMQWELVGCLALAWVIVCLCLIRGVKSSGKVVYFTALFPYAVLFILFIRGVTLEGFEKGVEFYIARPDWETLKKPEVWNDAATQIFYSLGSSFGGLITLSSYNKFKNNCMRDAIIIAFANCSTSVFAGFVIFSILGFMANELGKEVGDVVSSGSGLAFIVYPEAVTRMPYPPVWAILFFTMLITLGLDSQFTMVETLTTAIFDYWEDLRPKKSLIVCLMCFVLFILGLSMVSQGGIFMFELFNWYSAGFSVITLAIIEIIVIQYIYGFKRVMKNLQSEMGIWIPKPLYWYWAITWNVVTPLSLIVIFVMSVYYFVPAYWGDYVYPDWVQILGWFICCCSIVIIPIMAIVTIIRVQRCSKELITATADVCPAHVRNARQPKPAGSGQPPVGVFRYTYDNEGYQDGVAKVYPHLPNEQPPPYTNGAKYDNHV